MLVRRLVQHTAATLPLLDVRLVAWRQILAAAAALPPVPRHMAAPYVFGRRRVPKANRHTALSVLLPYVNTIFSYKLSASTQKATPVAQPPTLLLGGAVIAFGHRNIRTRSLSTPLRHPRHAHVVPEEPAEADGNTAADAKTPPTLSRHKELLRAPVERKHILPADADVSRPLARLAETASKTRPAAILRQTPVRPRLRRPLDTHTRPLILLVGLEAKVASPQLLIHTASRRRQFTA